ncbi:MAG: type II secretion system protein [Hydrogenophaga sp.]|uniref:type II secretion system protein n=1 Tax=Hydrogenophaga sp. TaxID=1904254 RepID=UPI003D0BD39A
MSITPMRYGHASRRQRGMTLVETAVAMAVMGVASLVLWQAVGATRVLEGHARAAAELERSEAAVRAFAAVHRRFPCPATIANGLESCEALQTSGFLPYLTLGLPEVKFTRIRYSLDSALGVGRSSFTVLVNDRNIDRDSDPRAAPVALKKLLPQGYDGMLDLCNGLSRVLERGAAAYLLELESPDLLVPPAQPDSQPVRAVSASQISSYLGCDAMVSVAGRGQYNAHLAAAIMSKATQDHRTQSEVAYAIHNWNLAEGVWSFANGMYAAMKKWAKLMQTSSALDANIWSKPGHFAALHVKAIADQAMEFVGLASRLSNLTRYIHQLDIAQENRRLHNQMVVESLNLYNQVTQHALKASSSAYFIEEQTRTPELPQMPGAAVDYGFNEQAQALATESKALADILGQGGLLAPYTALPSDARGR